MSRKIYLHLIENKMIDIIKEEVPPVREVLSEYWIKYLKQKQKKK